MAIANPASSQAGPQPEPHNELKSGPEIKDAGAGIEPKAALPVAAPTGPSSTTSAGFESGKVAVASSGKSKIEIGLDEPVGSFVSPLPVATPEESSASHLAGSSMADILSVDAKFQRLLETVHENRPGDDLDLIRKAWAFCLQQHEGQKRASGEPYVIHPLEVGQVLA